MPVPPPPPPPPPLGPPPPPPPPAQSPPEPPQLQVGGGGGRNALLADIQKGARLRKVTQVDDRSAPVVDKRRSISEDVSSSVGASQDSPGVSLSGLFAAGFPTLRPVRQRDSSGKIPVSRSSSSASLRPLWNPPTDSSNSSDKTDRGGVTHRPLVPSASAPPSPTFSSKHPPALPVYSPPPPPAPPLSAPPPPPAPLSAPPPPPAPLSAPPPLPPPPAFQDRPVSKPPPLPSCPPPPPPPPLTQVTKPMWLPLQPSQYIPQPSTPPPPPPPSYMHTFTGTGDRSSGSFYPPPPSPVHSEPSRFPILRDSPLGPPPPPPLPASYTPNCLISLQPPPPPKLAAVPSMRSLPPSYPCNAPTRRPPAVPRSAVVGRLAPPPAPPARSPSTELTCRIPPPPPPLPPSCLRNGHLHSLADDFESKFHFHPVEDLPPPEEFKPFPRIYPSKENRAVNSKPPGFRTHLR